MVSGNWFVFAWSPSGFDDDVAFRWTHGRIQRKAFHHLTVSDWKNRYGERSRCCRLGSGWRILTLFENFAQQDLCCWAEILERKPGVLFLSMGGGSVPSRNWTTRPLKNYSRVECPKSFMDETVFERQAQACKTQGARTESNNWRLESEYPL